MAWDDPAASRGTPGGYAPFVGRDVQLSALDTALAGAVAGQGGVRFVVGEAGSGKTALARAFAEAAERRYDDLIVASGQSDAQTGIGDAFLPFRELLAQLTGDVDAKLAQGGITEESASRLRRFLGVSGEAIVEFGPDLIGTFIPGAGLVTRAATYLARKTGHLEKLDALATRKEAPGTSAAAGIEQHHIFEQYTNLIVRLAEKQPLLLVLDDLQWADSASTGLLFRLGRSLEASRVLLVGTYRPAEVALGRHDERHPLEKVVAEFKRYLGDIVIDLGQVSDGERRGFVDALLDVERNRLDAGFRNALFEHTGGHPLFTIELLRALQEREALVLDRSGCWVARASLSWGALPARVEGVIEERIGRLDDDMHDTLTVASVEGEEFTAEVVAAVREVEERRLVRRLGRDLEDRHRLVRSRGLRRRSDGGRFSLFAFHHNLFQRYLYMQLNESERAYLHGDVGAALEELCGATTDEYAVQLARHFVEAGDATRAVIYLRRAAVLSLMRFANAEAVDYFTRALQLIPDADPARRWDVLASREQALALLGRRDAQAADLGDMRVLAADLADTQRQAETALRRAVLADATGDYLEAIEAAQEAIRFAGTTRDVAREAAAGVAWGTALVWLDRHDEAQHRLSHALALAESAGLHEVQASSLKSLARIHIECGDLASARRDFTDALRIAERTDDVVRQAQLSGNLGILLQKQGHLAQARTSFETVLELERRIGDRRGEGIALHNRGEVERELHDLAGARDSYRAAMDVRLSCGDQAGESLTLEGLGRVELRLGLLIEATRSLAQAREVAERTGQLSTLCSATSSLGMVDRARGRHRQAAELCGRAVGIAGRIEVPQTAATAFDDWGHVLEDLGEGDRADAAYEQAVTLRRQFGFINAAIESVGGLARVALARGDLATARHHVEDILAHLEVANLDSTDDPVGIYLTCWRVLEASGDELAGAMLDDGMRFLEGLAVAIPNAAERKSFHHHVPSHRELMRLSAATGRSPLAT